MNLDGIKPGELKLTGAVLADIYLGKIKKWNDKAIADSTPALKLPDENITVVRRSDGSGTTFLFTDYLSKVSAGVEGEGRREHRGGVARRRRRQGQRRRRVVCAAHQGGDRLRRIRVRQAATR